MNNNVKIESNVVDLSYLNDLFGEDLSAYAQMIQVFIMQTGDKVAELETAVSKEDYEKTKTTAHFLKSTFNMMGLQCNTHIEQIEELATNKESFSQIKPLALFVQTNFKESEVEFKRILAVISSNQ